MQKYTIAYKMYQADAVNHMEVEAVNKYNAYDIADSDIWEKGEGMPYSMWVESVTYANGRIKEFYTFEGKPF